MPETPSLSAGLLQAAAAIVDAAAHRTGNPHWRTIADRLSAAADNLDDTTATTKEHDDA